MPFDWYMSRLNSTKTRFTTSNQYWKVCCEMVGLRVLLSSQRRRGCGCAYLSVAATKFQVPEINGWLTISNESSKECDEMKEHSLLNRRSDAWTLQTLNFPSLRRNFRTLSSVFVPQKAKWSAVIWKSHFSPQWLSTNTLNWIHLEFDPYSRD